MAVAAGDWPLAQRRFSSTKLLAEVNRQLDARGLVIKRGTLIDAAIIAGAVRRP